MRNEPNSTRAGFTASYHGNPPWDTGRPQPPFVTVAGQVRGPVLDAGCGTGTTSLFLAARGLAVTGIDFVEEAIRRARAKAVQQQLPVEFLVMDAMTLADWPRHFASVIDSGLFHVYDGEERQRYVDGLAHVLEEDGRLYLYAFSDEEPGSPGGGVSVADLERCFAAGWVIESVKSIRGELNPAFVAESPDAFPAGGPMMRFAIIRRIAG